MGSTFIATCAAAGIILSSWTGPFARAATAPKTAYAKTVTLSDEIHDNSERPIRLGAGVSAIGMFSDVLSEWASALRFESLRSFILFLRDVILTPSTVSARHCFGAAPLQSILR